MSTAMTKLLREDFDRLVALREQLPAHSAANFLTIPGPGSDVHTDFVSFAEKWFAEQVALSQPPKRVEPVRRFPQGPLFPQGIPEMHAGPSFVPKIHGAASFDEKTGVLDHK